LKLLLVDDHEMFRQGMKFLLADLDEHLEFTDAASCEQAMVVLSSESIDMVLLDLNMPGSQGLSSLHEIKTLYPGLPIAVLSGEDNPSLVREAIDQGASGYVPKSSSSQVLIAALRLILAGGVYLPAMVLNAVSPPKAGIGEGAASPLSGRQTAVLLKAIQGKTNKVIARDLEIAEGTVKTHLSAAFKVLAVSNRTEAVYAAARLGLKPAESLLD
jgi:DNA-binding NarL/FixJ family response regulator